MSVVHTYDTNPDVYENPVIHIESWDKGDGPDADFILINFSDGWHGVLDDSDMILLPDGYMHKFPGSRRVFETGTVGMITSALTNILNAYIRTGGNRE